jgi:hypothetical protein
MPDDEFCLKTGTLGLQQGARAFLAGPAVVDAENLVA